MAIIGFLPTTSTVQSFLLSLLPIFLALCVFLSRVGFSFRLIPRGSHSAKDIHTQGAVCPTGRKPESTMATAAVSSLNLLDSGLEDLPVPILQPRSTVKDENSVDECQSSEAALLDRRLDHLMIPVLEPARVSGFRPCLLSLFELSHELGLLTCVLLRN